MTSERLLNLLTNRLAKAIETDLKQYSAQLHFKAAERMTKMHPSQRQALQNQLNAQVDDHAVELVIAYLRHGPATAQAEPEPVT